MFLFRRFLSQFQLKKLQLNFSTVNMQPLKLNQKFLTLVGLCAPADNVSVGKILLYSAVGLYVFVTLWSDFISSSFFLIQYKKRDMEDVLGSMLQTAAVSSNIFGMASTFMLSKRLRGVFSLFQTIYNECNWSIFSELYTIFGFRSCCFVRLTKNNTVPFPFPFRFVFFFLGSHDKSYEILMETEKECRRVTRILVIKYVTGLCVLSATLATLNVTACYLTEHQINVECLYTPYKHM